MTDARKFGTSLIKSIGSLQPAFWHLNILQMLEKLAYWSVLLQMPVYTAQKGIEGGLQWEQSIKGVIFFVWALVQNLTPFFFGYISDKQGRKRIIIISFLIIIISYIILATQRDFMPFLAGVLLLGLGSGLFKPALQGAVSNTMNDDNKSVGWGVYIMLLNLSVMAAPPLSKYLREISWDLVFYGSAAILVINLIVAYLINNKTYNNTKKTDTSYNLKTSLITFLKPRIYIFVLLMSGFAIIYMQFYETFPNFIIDWSDTSGIAATFGLPDFMTMEQQGVRMISYEWLYNINSIVIILFVVAFAWLTGFIGVIRAIIIGIILAIAGIMLAGTSMHGNFLVVGFVIYSIGEMITNPKFNEHAVSLSPKGQESMHLGYINLSLALGLGGGALMGGFLYGTYGEKANLAAKYMTEQNIINNSDENVFAFLMDYLGLSAKELTELLWNTYNPWIIFLPFALIAFIAIIGLFIYDRKFIR